MRNIVLRFDMRSKAECPDTSADRYRAALEMAEWADVNTVDVIGLSEHHDTIDGFLSAPLQLAGMMIARTQRIRVSVSALLVPLHDPVRLAEDIALLDNIARGRFSATCGLGYREKEYEYFGVNWDDRGQVFDDKLDILLHALKGDIFHYHGNNRQLNPLPVSPVNFILTMGGNSKAAARRAARFRLFFCPAIDDTVLELCYMSACLDEGFKSPYVISPREPATTFISNDPVACWKEIGHFLLYDAMAYRAWQHPTRRAYAESFASDLEELKREGKYRVLTPEQAIQTIQEKASLHLAPLTGGVPLSMAWQTLQIFEDQVQPYL